MYRMWLDFKGQNAATMDKMKDLRQQEIYKQQDLAEEIKNKLKRSEKVVEGFKQVQAHKQMLKVEQRKLQEEDMAKVHQRQKRLATRKKEDIMSKEVNNSTMVQEKRQRSQKLVDYRYRNRVLVQINTDQYNTSLNDWAKKGYTTSSLGKQDLELLSQIDTKRSQEREYIKSARRSPAV
jgi:hypothetical protein